MKLKPYQQLWVISTLLDAAVADLGIEECEVYIQAAQDFIQFTLETSR